MALEQILREHRFTNGLTGSGLAKLASLACEETFEQDQVILLSGQQSRGFLLAVIGERLRGGLRPLTTPSAFRR